MANSEKIILALDLPESGKAFKLLDSLDGLIDKVKVGPALFIHEGPALIQTLQSRGYQVFLDLKLHDIPNTIALGVSSAKKLGVWMLSIHLSGGRKMLEAAVREAAGKPLLAGITVLTSFDASQFEEIGLALPLEEQVKRLANLGARMRLPAVVASPKEVGLLRELLGKNTLVITPGIRLESLPSDDQTRTLTPREAIEAGADYLVIGRPILQAQHPKQALSEILLSIEKAKKA